MYAVGVPPPPPAMGFGEDRWVLCQMVEIWESKAEAEAMDGVVCVSVVGVGLAAGQ